MCGKKLKNEMHVTFDTWIKSVISLTCLQISPPSIKGQLLSNKTQRAGSKPSDVTL